MFDKIKFFSTSAAFLLLISQLAFAAEADDLMKQGNEFYQDKQYEKAIDTY